MFLPFQNIVCPTSRSAVSLYELWQGGYVQVPGFQILQDKNGILSPSLLPATIAEQLGSPKRVNQSVYDIFISKRSNSIECWFYSLDWGLGSIYWTSERHLAADTQHAYIASSPYSLLLS